MVFQYLIFKFGVELATTIHEASDYCTFCCMTGLHFTRTYVTIYTEHMFGERDNMVYSNNCSLMDKLTILSDAAKYDAACTSSGVDKKNNGQGIGNAKACGICHSFSADGRCISLLKILFTNECIFDCRYCVNRVSNDVVRATFTPEEVCSLTMEFYRRNYIEGLFLSSGIIKNPEYTMQLLLETVMLLRTKYHFGGYIHLKGIPGAPQELIEMAGWYVDRMSVNIELPTAQGLRSLAPHKTRKNILTPMRMIQNGIQSNRMARLNNSTDGRMNQIQQRAYDSEKVRNSSPDFLRENLEYTTNGNKFADLRTEKIHGNDQETLFFNDKYNQSAARKRSYALTRGTQNATEKRFVPGGQSTQMIIGATPESDYQIVTVAEALYRQYDLKRVFYSAFVNVNQDESLPMQVDGKGVPLLREHRLYQADWLLRYYGFQSGELLSEAKPNFNVLLDPKCDWAVSHLENFPVEINRADYYTLLRVPGIGVTSARRILHARKFSKLDYPDLKKMGVVLKRALYFITCSGKMMYQTQMNEDYITRNLIDVDKRRTFELSDHNIYQQLSLFDDGYNILPDHQEQSSVLTGQI